MPSRVLALLSLVSDIGLYPLLASLTGIFAGFCSVVKCGPWLAVGCSLAGCRFYHPQDGVFARLPR